MNKGIKLYYKGTIIVNIQFCYQWVGIKISILSSKYRKQKCPNSFFEWPFCERASQDAESSMISFQSWQKTLTVS